MAISELSKIGKSLKDFRESPQTAVSSVLEAFTAQAISQLKQNLRDSGKHASGGLSQSIAPLPIEIDNEGNIVLQIEMEDYWDFVNSGVNGTQNNWGSEYLFRRTAQTPTSQGKSFPESIREWMAFKSITSLSWQDKNGEFVTKMLSTDKDYRSAAFVIMQGIKKKGLEPTYFVDKFMTDKTINELIEGVEDAIAKDLLK